MLAAYLSRWIQRVIVSCFFLTLHLTDTKTPDSSVRSRPHQAAHFHPLPYPATGSSWTEVELQTQQTPKESAAAEAELERHG